MQKLGDFGSFLGGMSGFAMAVIAGVALCVAQDEIAEARRIDAQVAYREYVALAVQYPTLAEGDLAIISKDSEISSKYPWFVAVMLSAYEQILETESEDQAWMKAIRSGLGMHRSYLSGDEFADELCEYDPKLRKLIVSEAGTAPQACDEALNARS